MSTSTSRPPARERLLDAAEELFYERGIAATGVDAVLTRAGAAPATLYAHFPGKEHLVAAYLERRLARWRAAWDDALDRAGDDVGARLLALFDALESFPRHAPGARGCAFLAAAVEVHDPAHPAHRWLLADSELLTTRLRALAADAGAPDPAALAEQLLLVYDGALAARSRRSLAAGAPGTVPDSARALATALLTQALLAS